MILNRRMLIMHQNNGGHHRAFAVRPALTPLQMPVYRRIWKSMKTLVLHYACEWKETSIWYFRFCVNYLMETATTTTTTIQALHEWRICKISEGRIEPKTKQTEKCTPRHATPKRNMIYFWVAISSSECFVCGVYCQRRVDVASAEGYLGIV